MDQKFLRLNADPTGCSPGSWNGPCLINIAWIVAVGEYVVDQDKAPRSRLGLSTGCMIQVKESVDYIQRWLVKAPMANSGIVNADEDLE